MTTLAFRALTNKVKHTVGNLSSMDKYIEDVPNGAIFLEDVENYHLVELGFDSEGRRTAKNLTDNTKESYLAASKEVRFLGENIFEFFNGKDEEGRIVRLTKGLEFDVSAFALDATVSTITAGQSAHFDVATKKYIIHDGTHADFATANAKFRVITSQDNLDYTLGLPMVGFEVL